MIFPHPFNLLLMNCAHKCIDFVQTLDTSCDVLICLVTPRGDGDENLTSSFSSFPFTLSTKLTTVFSASLCLLIRFRSDLQ